MIAGLSHLSAAFSAMRVAEAAQARAEQAREQVATGRRVNSAKDDGAAFTVELRARSEARAWDVVNQRLSWVRGMTEASLDYQSTRVERLNRLYESALAATEPGLSAEQRAIRVNEHTQLYDAFVSGGVSTLVPISNSSGGAWTMAGTVAANAAARFLMDAQGGFIDHVVPTMTVANAQLDGVATDTAAATTLGNVATYRSEFLGRLRDLSALTKQMGVSEERAQQMRDLMLQAAHAATGADMGKVSNDLEAAETRAQIATEGASRAIQIYGRAQSAVLDAALSNWSRVRTFA